MFFEHFYKLFVWGISFGVLAYALWRWGATGFLMPAGNVIGKFFKMLWDMIRERPILMIAIPIIALLIGLSYIMK